MKMKKVEISVIVPIYNVEKYLKNCLVSLENQTFKNFEVILVNDGSRDNSQRIAEEFCKENQNFKLINQENKGLGGARNTGIKFSNGKFLFFLDSDDSLTPDALEKMYDAAIFSGSEIILGRPVWFYEHSVKGTYLDFLFKPTDYYLKINDWKEIAIVTSQLISKQLFDQNEIKFPENMTGEDVQVSLALQNYTNSIYCINNITYLRTDRDDESNKSITQQFNLKIINDRLKSTETIINQSVKKKLIGNKWNRVTSNLQYIVDSLKVYDNPQELDLIYQSIFSFLNKHKENKIFQIVVEIVFSKKVDNLLILSQREFYSWITSLNNNKLYKIKRLVNKIKIKIYLNIMA